ncbi:MAG: hypothetical protein EOO53_03785 [Gammaproteobacteria bacterium]|nr:MAG: hypothetical protein EOO53_03785 [Gammaproteobacteria bacterium]
MNNILNNVHTWFLDKINYEGELELFLVEGKKGKPEQLKILGADLGIASPVNTASDSSLVKITFGNYVTWQCVNESFSAFSEYEVGEKDRFFQVLSTSKYLDYVNETHGWYIHVIGSAKHFRVWTENEVIEVIAFEDPKIELVEA